MAELIPMKCEECGYMLFFPDDIGTHSIICLECNHDNVWVMEEVDDGTQ